MSVFSIFVFMIVAFGSFFVSVGVMIYRTFAQIGSSPQGNAFKSKVSELEALVARNKAELSVWESDTLNLLCATPSSEKNYGLLVKTQSTGTLSTIYQEPVASYGKAYVGENLLLIVHTRDDAYQYRKTKQQTDIWVNGELMGVLVDGNLLSGDQKGTLLGRVAKDADSTEPLVYLKDQAVANLMLNHRTDEVNPRAVQTLTEPTPNDKKILIALVFYYLLGHKTEI
jgi:hypothetical protein